MCNCIWRRSGKVSQKNDERNIEARFTWTSSGGESMSLQNPACDSNSMTFFSKYYSKQSQGSSRFAADAQRFSCEVVFHATGRSYSSFEYVVTVQHSDEISQAGIHIYRTVFSLNCFKIKAIYLCTANTLAQMSANLQKKITCFKYSHLQIRWYGCGVVPPFIKHTQCFIDARLVSVATTTASRYQQQASFKNSQFNKTASSSTCHRHNRGQTDPSRPLGRKWVWERSLRSAGASCMRTGRTGICANKI